MCAIQTPEQILDTVRERYANAATRAATSTSTNAGACCGADCCEPEEIAAATDGFGAALYPRADLAALPAEAVAASLGCGNPTALATLAPGEVVLDLGSGGGIDVLLSAQRVGETGKAYGLDMTDEMLALARENQRKAGATNVEFLRGRIEDIPLPGNSIDVIISNCVVNLSTDKGAVFREAERVLRPGGRVAISDVVIRNAAPGEPAIPDAVRRDIELWAGCIAGALEAREYREKLAAAGFTGIEIEEVHRYTTDTMCDSTCCGGSAGEKPQVTDEVAGRFISAFIRAVKPGHARA